LTRPRADAKSPRLLAFRQGDRVSQLLIFPLMFAVFYFIMIRPQVKKQKEHQALLRALQKGDSVITRGGIIGKISGLTDTVITLELQEKVRVRVLRSYVEGKYDETAAAAKPAADDKAA
jgi:preprotein translocase subunit YajC